MFKNFDELKMDKKVVLPVLVTEVTQQKASNGKEFCRVLLQDGSNGENIPISAVIWDKTKEEFLLPLWNNKECIEKGEPLCEVGVMTAAIYTKLYREKESYEIQGYGPAPDELDISKYRRQAPEDSLHMYNYLTTLINPDTIYGQLVSRIYEDNKPHLMYASAAKSMHHNMYGGLLYHTYRMAKMAVKFSEVYHNINRDLLLAGVILHDIGKLYEMDTDQLGVAKYTIPGNLEGHLVIGRDMVRDTAMALGLADTNEVKYIQHMILSHHGRPEYGNVKNACFTEAMLLHMIDDADAKIFMFEEAYKELKPGEMSDTRIFGLDANVLRPDFFQD